MAPAASWRFTATATSKRLIVVEVVNRRVIWAAGGGFLGATDDGSVVRTIDGGQSWLDVTPPGGVSQAFRDVVAFDANRALVLAVGYGPASRIYRTVDGGGTWELVFTNDDPAAFYDGMAFFDESRGLAVSDAVGGSFPLLVTVDGGSNWSLVPGGVPGALSGEGVFATGTALVTVGPNDAWFGTTATDDHNPRVFHTDDGGSTWTVADTPIPGSPSGAGIRSLSFRDPRHGLAVSGTPPTGGTAGVGVAARTSDGGLTWELVGATTGFRNSVAWIWGRTAVAVGNPGSDLSTDEGNTWTRFDQATLWGVHGPTRPLCWAVGDGGMAAELVISP